MGLSFATYQKRKIMSQMIKIVTPLSPATVTTIKTAVTSITALVAPIIIAVTETQKKGLLGVGPSRAAEIKDIVSKIMEPFPQTIPSDFTLAQCIALDQEQMDSEVFVGIFTYLAEVFTVHGEIVGNNRMLMAIGVLDNARVMGKTDVGINTAYKSVKTDHLTPGPKVGITTYSIAPSAILEVTGLKKGKKIINNGTTILSVLSKNGNAANTITINPGDSADTPKGWTNVTITNLSATTTGSFEVYL
jgi:hypothetical protein